MPLVGTPRPTWLTFDSYGTLIQWDEGLVQAVGRILAEQEALPKMAPFPEVADTLAALKGPESRMPTTT